MATSGNWRAPSIAFPPRPSAVARRLAAVPARLAAALEHRFEAEREQLPLWLPVGLGLGIAAWFMLPNAAAWSAFICAAGALVAALLPAAGRSRTARALAIFCLAGALGCALIWLRAERIAAPMLTRPQAAAFTAEVRSLQKLPARQAVRLVLEPADATLPRLRVNVAEEDAPGALRAGATVRLRAYLMPPPERALPGAYDFSRAAWFQRIGATGRAIGPVEVVSQSDRVGWSGTLSTWRQRLADHIRARLPAGEGGIASALATGDQGGVPEADAEAMRRSGLAHLLSVSGLHLTAVVGAVMFATLKLLALSPTLALRAPLVLIAAGAGAVAGIAYTLLTGAEVPTVRACIAALLVLAGIALGRDALTLRLVATGALAVLLLWPESLVGASFQLSFAAIVAIVALHEQPAVKRLLQRRDEAVRARLGRALLALVLTGLAVEIALAPIALFHFHKAGFYGAAANIVAIPLTTFVIMPLEAAALLLDTVGLGAPAWWLAGQALALLLRLAHLVADAPGAVAMLPTVPTAAFAATVAGGLWLLLWRTGWRWLGVAPFAAGASLALAAPEPDLLVTADGRHLAIRTASGYALLRDRAGDYVRDMLAENAGSEEALAPLESLPNARCSADLCVAELAGDGRIWRLLATRSSRFLDFGPMAQACAAADIVVSDRRLPSTCRPRWLKADRALLARTGGLAVTLGAEPEVAIAASGSHPWRVAARRPELRARAAAPPVR